MSISLRLNSNFISMMIYGFSFVKRLDKFYVVNIIVVYNMIPIKAVKGIRHNRLSYRESVCGVNRCLRLCV